MTRVKRLIETEMLHRWELEHIHSSIIAPGSVVAWSACGNR